MKVPYSVEMSVLAIRQLQFLGKAEAERLAAKLEEAASDPDRYFKRLTGRSESRLRVGDYRIIAHVLHPSKRIVIEGIGHRKSIYKRIK